MLEQKLELIYALVSNGIELTSETLHKHKITDDDIKYFIDIDRIVEKENGKYDISYTSDLLDFAIENIKNRNFPISESAIERCYESNPDDFEVLNFKFLNELNKSYKNHNFDEPIKFIYILKDNADRNEIKDINLYIFLFSMITELPDDLRLIAKYINQNDILINISDERYSDIYNRNINRKDIIYQKFTLGLRNSKKINDKTNENFVYDRIIARLLEEAATIQKNRNKHIETLINEDKIEEVIKIYNEEDEKRKLKKHEEYILKLCNVLYNIRKNRIISVAATHKENVIFYDYIDNKDYDGALKKIIEMCEANKTPVSKNINYILLSKINNEIDSMKNTKSLSLIIKKNK